MAGQVLREFCLDIFIRDWSTLRYSFEVVEFKSLIYAILGHFGKHDSLVSCGELVENIELYWQYEASGLT